jgi:hypothetical protein
MHKIVRRRVFWTWIAALAFLFGTWAPAISHAIAFSNAKPVEEVQVCTMEGMQTILIVPAPSGKTDPHTSARHLEHCPCCATHAGPGLPSPSRSAFAVPGVAIPFPQLFYRSATPLFAWTSSSPRGPPARHR